MTEGFTIDLAFDDALGIFRVVASGPINSDRFVDSQIELFSQVEKPWAYNRLVDVRDCIGSCAYDSLSRFAAYWSSMQFQIDRTILASVVTRNGLTVARLPTIELMFPKHEMRSYTDMDMAQAWLEQPDFSAQPAAKAPNRQG